MTNLTQLLLATTLSWFAVHQDVRADTVTLNAGEDDTGTIKISGEVVDLTGQEVTLRRTGGIERSYRASRIRTIETTWPDGYENGLAAMANNDYRQAAELLATAARAEERAWVRRLAMEHLMRCYDAAGDTTTAGRLLIELDKSDPTTRAIEHAPLAWFATDRVLPSTVERWISNASSPIAQLLGASYALSSSDRDRAIARLRVLVQSPDTRIAWLSEMQIWRTKIVTAAPTDLTHWETRLREAPESLQSGGWLVLGDVHRQQQRFDQAALAYLRSSMLADRQPQLAASALWRASRVLATAGQQAEAAKLAKQLEREFPQTAAAREAQGVLQSP